MQALATEAEAPSRELGAARAALATARAELTAREDKVLQILSNAQGDILEDEQLQHILHVVGEAQERIGTAAAGFAKVEEQVAELRSALKPLAARGAVLFFVLQDMQQADASYAFGFEIFGTLFASAFSAAPRAEVQHTRVEALIETLTLEVAKMVVRQTTARTQDK